MYTFSINLEPYYSLITLEPHISLTNLEPYSTLNYFWFTCWRNRVACIPYKLAVKPKVGWGPGSNAQQECLVGRFLYFSKTVGNYWLSRHIISFRAAKCWYGNLISQLEYTYKPSLTSCLSYTQIRKEGQNNYCSFFCIYLFQLMDWELEV